MAVSIRNATESDTATISALNKDVQAIHAAAVPSRFKTPGPETFTVADASAFIAQPGYFGLIAEWAGAPVGYAIARLMQNPETPFAYPSKMLYVHQISVRPEYRRRGVGRALLDCLKQKGSAAGATRLTLEAWAFNSAALDFFQGYGLAPASIRLWSEPLS